MPRSTTIRSIRRRAATTVTALALACGLGVATIAHGAGTVSAPEPAKLSAKLDGATGATAAAVFASSQAPTQVLFYTSSWTPTTIGPEAGTPCSAFALPIGQTTTHVIQTFASGSFVFRRCF